MPSEKVQQGLEARTTIPDKCPKTKPCAESVFYPANICAKGKAGMIWSCLQPSLEYPAGLCLACLASWAGHGCVRITFLWKRVLNIGLLTRFWAHFKSWKAEEHDWNNNHRFLQLCFKGGCWFVHGFWKTGLKHRAAKVGPGASISGWGSSVLTCWSSRLRFPVPYLVQFHMQHICCKSLFPVASSSSQHCP